jgi:hypothetical protein
MTTRTRRGGVNTGLEKRCALPGGPIVADIVASASTGAKGIYPKKGSPAGSISAEDTWNGKIGKNETVN